MQARQTIDLTSEHLISAIEFTLQFDEPNPIAHPQMVKVQTLS